MSRRRALLGAVLLVLLGPGACGEETPGPTVERADSAGVEIVENGAGDRPLKWTLHEVFGVGGEPDGPESFYRVEPSTVAADGKGKLYVLDRTAQRVVVFDDTGRVLRTLGGAG